MNYWENNENNNNNNLDRQDYFHYDYQPDLGTRPPAIRSRNRRTKSGYVTKKGFILGLICCMLFTSGLTIGGLSLLGAFNKNGPGTNTISATNYTLASSTDTTKSIEEIVAMNENAVVEIQTEAVATGSWIMNYVTQGAGSGVIIDSEGYILTCYHVIEDAKTISVITRDGTQHDAKIIGGDVLTDIAVLKIDGTGYTAVTYGDSEKLTVGDLAVAIGNPLGKLGGSASVGIISSLDRELELDGKLMNLLQTDASINPGNSGGGLFDGYGNLIGVVVAKSIGSDVEGLGFAIPVNDAAAIAKDIIENGKVTERPLIGVSVIDATSEIIARQYGYSEPGIYIVEVTGMEAKAAGLKANDIISKVNDKEITSRATLTAAINQYRPGDEVTLTIIRNGETMEIKTILTEAD